MKKNLTTPSIRRGKRKSGFRSRMRKKSGRKVINSRRQKGRKRVSI